MPLYEYRCNSCGEVFEVIQKFSDAPLSVHEKCGGSVERLVSTSAFNFKGTGWYVTDYAKNGKGAAKSESGDGDKAGAKKSEPSKSEAAKSDSSKSDSAKSDSSSKKPSSSSKL